MWVCLLFHIFKDKKHGASLLFEEFLTEQIRNFEKLRRKVGLEPANENAQKNCAERFSALKGAVGSCPNSFQCTSVECPTKSSIPEISVVILVGVGEGGCETKLSFIRRDSAPRSKPLPFCIPIFYRKGFAFTYLLYPYKIIRLPYTYMSLASSFVYYTGRLSLNLSNVRYSLRGRR